MVRRSVYQGTNDVYSTSSKYPDYYFVWVWNGKGYVPKFKTKSFENLSSIPQVDFKLHENDVDFFFKEEINFFQEDSE